ncbi:MAG: efflux RND transporter periplasmic adaptor subunit [Candidatus Pacebacteria bacterium]|nr:efflux RND transporter periplasmic adaptor subunit [Candidatus Paceibacterota bacterium]
MKSKIKNILQKIKSFWTGASTRRKFFYVAILAIVVLIIVKNGGDATGSVVETVKKQTITRTVVASGKVVSSTDLSLGFEVSDIVRNIYVKVGDKVRKGAIIASLNSGEERAAVTSAKGALLSAEARYKKVLDGSSNEEIALAQVNLDNAKKDLETIKKTQDTLVLNAKRKLFSDGLVAEPANSTYISSTPLVSGTYSGTEGFYNINVSSSGNDFVNFSGIETGTSKYSTTSTQSLGTKGLYIIFPSGSNLSQGGNWIVNIPNTSSSSYVANLNAYNQALDTRDANISSAQSLVAQREAELNLKRATARQPDVDSALADVITAGAGVESANARLEKKILRAPADGTITKVDIKAGEISTPQKEIIVLQDISNLYLEANVGEGNISTISLGQMVDVSYDAFPGQTYEASVSSIDPSATESGTIINYKIKALVEDIENVRPGMTANMSIVTAEIPDVLVVPGRVIQKDDEGQFVNLVVPSKSRKTKTIRTEVVTGLKGDGDIIEIKTGLSEGQKILWSPTVK